MSSVTLRGVGVRFPGGNVGLSGIDLDIADGEFIALLGPSGSGKTTVLRTIAGFISPSEGTVSIAERVVADARSTVPPEEREIGMVFQQHAVWPHLSVAKNVAYPLDRARSRGTRGSDGRRLNGAERHRRVVEALRLVGLDGLEQRTPATLSGGQRQRVALARAIVARPRVLLLDEALSALDEPLRNELRLELQSLTRSIGLTVVHVTHDRDEALALADRVVVLDGGRILDVASPPEIVSRPVNARVAAFLSDATVLGGRLDAEGFRAEAHGCAVSRERLEIAGGTRQSIERHAEPGAASREPGPAAVAGPGEIAILPEHVEIVAPEASSQRATVTSSLYGRGGNDVVLDWDGVRLRCRTSEHRPVVGEEVGVRLRAALFYAAEPGDGSADAPCGSGEPADGLTTSDIEADAARGGSLPVAAGNASAVR